MTDLLPCPFCDCHLELKHKGWFDHPKSDCVLSGLAVHKSLSSKWNTRTPPQITEAMVDAAIQGYSDVLPADGDFADAMRAALVAAMGAR